MTADSQTRPPAPRPDREASADASTCDATPRTDVAAPTDVAAGDAPQTGIPAGEQVPAGPVVRAIGRVRPMPVSVVRAIGRVEPSHPGMVWPVLVPPVIRAVARVPGALSVSGRPPPWPPRFLERPPAILPTPESSGGGLEPDPVSAAGAIDAAPERHDEAGAERPEQRMNEAGREAPAIRAAVPAIRPALPEPGRLGRAAEEGRDGADPVRNAGLLKRLGGRAALPAATAAVAAFVVGTGYLAVMDPRGQVSEVGRWGAHAATAAPVIAANAGVGPSAGPFGVAAATATGEPSRLRVKAIGLDVTLEKLHLGADGVLVPPTGFAHAGWYADGTAPGDPGPAVIAGHVDSKSGPAVFYRLRELTAGDRIEVVRGGTVVRFTVTRTAWYPKTKFPTSQVYGPTPDRQLRLITCGGVFDHRLRSYKDNLVVYAVAG